MLQNKTPAVSVRDPGVMAVCQSSADNVLAPACCRPPMRLQEKKKPPCGGFFSQSWRRRWDSYCVLKPAWILAFRQYKIPPTLSHTPKRSGRSRTMLDNLGLVTGRLPIFDFTANLPHAATGRSRYWRAAASMLFECLENSWRFICRAVPSQVPVELQCGTLRLPRSRSGG